MLEGGRYGTIEELAKAERINPSYLARVLRLTLLAPGIVESILGGNSSEAITLDRVMKPFAVEWERQRFQTCLSSAPLAEVGLLPGSRLGAPRL
jgi:hypothetical protein